MEKVVEIGEPWHLNTKRWGWDLGIINHENNASRVVRDIRITTSHMLWK